MHGEGTSGMCKILYCVSEVHQRQNALHTKHQGKEITLADIYQGKFHCLAMQYTCVQNGMSSQMGVCRAGITVLNLASACVPYQLSIYSGQHACTCIPVSLYSRILGRGMSIPGMHPCNSANILGPKAVGVERGHCMFDKHLTILIVCNRSYSASLNIIPPQMHSA